MTSQQLQAAGNKLLTFQDSRKGSGGRWPKVLKSGHRAHRAQGMAVAKRYVGGLLLLCRSFKPFPNKLVYSRFPPGSGSLPPDTVLLQSNCFPDFLTCQTGRRRQCPKRVSRRLQEGSKRSQKEHCDHQISLVFYDFVIALDVATSTS